VADGIGEVFSLLKTGGIVLPPEYVERIERCFSVVYERVTRYEPGKRGYVTTIRLPDNVTTDFLLVWITGLKPGKPPVHWFKMPSSSYRTIRAGSRFYRYRIMTVRIPKGFEDSMVKIRVLAPCPLLQAIYSLSSKLRQEFSRGKLRGRHRAFTRGKSPAEEAHYRPKPSGHSLTHTHIVASSQDAVHSKH